jgi:NADP-dependent 3-hydroxy acid dehydrogenase YdfG
MGGALAGKTALVTGASSGIGAATALAIAEAGAAVALSARRADRLEALVARIAAAGGRAVAIPGDVTDEAAAKAAVAGTVQAFGRIDILVNSAGIIQAGNIETGDAEAWRRVMDVNFFGTLYPCQAAVPHMKAQGGGDIVNVTSTSGRRLSAIGFGAYAPSKHAVTSMSEALRQEVGLSGIRVCLIEPGAVQTEVAENISDPAVREAMRAHVGKDEAVRPEEVANTIVFVLAQPARTNICEVMIRPTIDVVPL